MKKFGLSIVTVVLLSSCLQTNKIYYSKNMNKWVHNLEQIEKFIQEDYMNGYIPKDVAHNYLTIVRYTKCSIEIENGVDKVDCFD